MGGAAAMQLIINMRHVFIHDKQQKISKIFMGNPKLCVLYWDTAQCTHFNFFGVLICR